MRLRVPGLDRGLGETGPSPLLVAALIAAATFLAYLPTLRCGYVWDDDQLVTANRPVLSDEGFRDIWLRPASTQQYYPAVFTSFWLERKLWGLQPITLHLVNVLLHAASAVLLWRVLRRLGLAAAWPAALVFGLHPVHVESVAWIAERKNCLSGVFYLAAALAYLRFARIGAAARDTAGGEDPRAAARRSLALCAAALVLFTLALLSKTVTGSLPAALLLVVWWKRGRVGRRDVGSVLPMFVLAFALGLVTIWMERHSIGAKGEEWSLSFAERILVAGRALWFYAGKLAWPHELTFTYPLWRLDTGSAWQYVPVVGSAVVVVALWLARRRLGRGPLVAVLFFAGTLVPALGFFDVYPMRYSFVADHFQYLASIGPIALAAEVAVRAWRRAAAGGPGRRSAWAGQAAWALVLLAAGALIWGQCHAYADQETLLKDTLRKNPTCFLALNNLGVLHNERGEQDLAARHFRAALAQKPDFVESLCNLGTVLAAQGRAAEAKALYRQALATDPRSPHALYNLGEALQSEGDLRGAEKQYRLALTTDPEMARAHNNLANLLAAQGRADEARRHYEVALHHNPDYAEAHSNYAILLEQDGRIAAAEEHHRTAIRLDRGLAEPYNNLAALLARRGRLAEAEACYREALARRPANATVHANLADLLARTGRTDAAEREYAASIGADPRNAQATFGLGMLRERRGDYAGAREAFVQAVKVAPDWAEAHNHLGVAAAREGRYREAVRHLEEAVRLKPDYGQARTNLTLAIGLRGKAESRVDALKARMVEAPNDAEASREAGLLLSNLGRDEESAEAFRASVRALRQPETLNNLGVVLARLAKYGEALESVREALRLKPDYEEARRNLAAIERRSREEREPVGGALPSNAKPARVAD